MNRIKLRAMAVCLAALALTACAGKPAAAVPAAAALALPPETTAPPTTQTPETTAPPTTQAPETEPEPQPERFLLTFAGDCTLGATPANYYAGLGFIKTVGEDYAYPFANVLDYFAGDDLTLVNLEGALCDQGTAVTKRFNFRGPTDYVNILTRNSVEAVSVANNHTMDYGQKGYDATLATLEAAGVHYVEQNTGTLITLDSGLTIGLYGAQFARLDRDDIAAGITALREAGAELVIFATHWGTEYTYKPTSTQQKLGRAAIDAGADIVFGTHPHVLQPIEYYNDGVIFYSLGNFCFGGNTSPPDLDTALVQQEVLREADGTVHLGQLTIVPASVSSAQRGNNYQPTPYAPDSAEYGRVLEKLGMAPEENG